MPAFGVFLVHIFPHLDLIRRDTLYLSVFGTNAGKYGQEKKSRNTATFHAVLVGLVVKLKLLEVHFKTNGSFNLKIHHFQIIVVFNAFFPNGDYLFST